MNYRLLCVLPTAASCSCSRRPGYLWSFPLASTVLWLRERTPLPKVVQAREHRSGLAEEWAETGGALCFGAALGGMELVTSSLAPLEARNWHIFKQFQRQGLNYLKIFQIRSFERFGISSNILAESKTDQPGSSHDGVFSWVPITDPYVRAR